MALFWHPYLADSLRRHYGQHLEVHETVALGDLPLEADLLLIRRDLTQALPYPYTFLGSHTLLEFKSPDDRADQAALVQLETYGLLWLQRQQKTRRSDLTLWLVASQFTQNVSQAEGAALQQMVSLGPGVQGGKVDGFPIYLVDLQDVPFTPDTLPLHMVVRGKQEQALVEYLVTHHQHHQQDLELLQRLHPKKLVEVLHMRNLTAEQMGLDYQALLELLGKERALDLIGEQAVLEHIGKQRALDLIGKERALDLIGKEQALGLIGEEAVRQWLRQHEHGVSEGTPATPPSTEPAPEKPKGPATN